MKVKVQFTVELTEEEADLYWRRVEYGPLVKALLAQRIRAFSENVAKDGIEDIIAESRRDAQR